MSAAASSVHTTFGGLRAFYEAPEAEQLFATTKPVADKGVDLGSDLRVIAGALGTYADTIGPLVKRLGELRAQAVTFRERIAGDDEWREDGDLIDENLERRNAIAEVWTQFQEAERSCHAKIVALVGGEPLKINDGSNAKNMYGYDAEALKQAESLPWATPSRSRSPGTTSTSTPGSSARASSWTACGARSRAWAPWSASTAGTRPARRGPALASSSPAW